MKTKKTLIAGLVFAASLFIIIFMTREPSAKTTTNSTFITIEKGPFEISVFTTGELQAENYSDILAPSGLQSRSLRINSISISDLVAEGTEVKKGDYVATLDRTDLDNTLKTELDALSTLQTNYEMKLLDTAVTLSEGRDQIKNIYFSVEEAKITLAQSKYEPPATIRQAEISLDKVNRSLDQAKNNYNFKILQTSADVKTAQQSIRNQEKKVNDLQDVLNQFEVTAPADGMVIYKRDAQGTKRKVGSTISQFDLVVATLPDLSSMVSKTYVNEIDIDKVKIGMDVEIQVDAFTGRKYTGKIMSVSNIGEQLPSANAKVFEVNIIIDEIDNVLRPAMTSGNKIIVKSYSNVISVPLGSIIAENNKTFVLTNDKIKKEVVVGESNEDEIIIESGLNPGDIIYSYPLYLLSKN